MPNNDAYQDWLTLDVRNEPNVSHGDQWRWVCKCGHRGRWQYTQRDAWILSMDHYYKARHHLP